MYRTAYSIWNCWNGKQLWRKWKGFCRKCNFCSMTVYRWWCRADRERQNSAQRCRRCIYR